MSFLINPKRLIFRTWQQRLRFIIQYPFVRFGLWLGFPNLDYGWVNGYDNRIKIGQGCSTMNTTFSTHSGTITIGDNTIFGYDCMVLTGQHRFYKGKRSKLQPDCPFKEVPDEGKDITIGSGCYISSGAIILGGVTIGDNVIIGLDASDGFLATDAWTRVTSTRAVDFAKEVESLGGRCVIYTDIAKDGALSGPNLKEIKVMCRAVGTQVIVSGGIGSLADLSAIRALGQKNISGVIIGKALYENKFRLKDAIENCLD